MSANVIEPPGIEIIQRKVPVTAEHLHENELLHRLLASRGVQTQSDCSFSLSDLPRPDALPQVRSAVDRLLQARDSGERILVVGDYDCDGATSTVVALQGLAMLGFNEPGYIIPTRFGHGYGLSPAIIDLACEQDKPGLILTVDNGVASVDAVKHAALQGIDVVVTDHHLAPARLPDAVAIVNPNLPDATFASKNLAGVGVIFYLLLAIRARLKSNNDIYARAPLPELLDLVAIGTVADVVPLDSVNRKLVEQGLRRIRAGQTRCGVLALLKVAGRDAQNTSTQDIGFAIGPRLNAAGRMDDMRVGVQCLMSEHEQEAEELAAQLQELNQRRRSVEGNMLSEAERQLNNSLPLAGHSPDSFAICLNDESWHEGVIGILAGRVKEAHYKPAVIFTSDGPTTLKGSARSIPGVHIRDVLHNVAAQHDGLIVKFGGHAMAAGLTVQAAGYEIFRHAFNEEVKKALQGRPSVRRYLTDGSLSDEQRSLANAMLLVNGMPWGQGFEAPVFHDTFRIVEQNEVGKGHLKLQLQAPGSDRCFDAIAFNQQPAAQPGDDIDVVYSLEANNFRKQCSLQLRVQYMKAAG